MISGFSTTNNMMMRPIRIFALLIVAATTAGATSSARVQTPPMGWTSWNAFTTDVDQELVEATAKALVEKGLAAPGNTYVNVDSCWQGSRSAKGTLALQPNGKFPDMAGMVRRIHALGLKAGIYSTPMVIAWYLS